MVIHIAADHAGFEHKQAVTFWLQEKGFEVIDHGAVEFNPDDDFVDFMFPAARAVANDNDAMGIFFGGSGQGEAMAANRVRGVRAAVYYGVAQAHGAVDASGSQSVDEYEIVRLSRTHNNANVLSIGARFVTLDECKKVIDLWLNQPFSDNPRYAKRNEELDNQ